MPNPDKKEKESHLEALFIAFVIVFSIIGLVASLWVIWFYFPKWRDNPEIISEKETSIIKELEECRKAGGEFWIHQQWRHEKFPAYNMYCEITNTPKLFEYKD